MATQGVDYAWSRPDIGQLAAAGKTFACRYGGPGSAGKQLDPGEAAALIAAGVAIVANAEEDAAGLLRGFAEGVDWASKAEAHFVACGMPPGRPIYFSVDFDVTSIQWPSVAEALRGAASVLGGVHRVGVYGGRRAIELARRDGVAAWFWQTYAWSGGVWVPGNHIEQYSNHVELAGATLDLDRALLGDFGQWTVGGDGVQTEGQRNIGYAIQNGLFGLEEPAAHIPPEDGYPAAVWPSPFAEVLKAITEGRDAHLPAFANIPARRWTNGTAVALAEIKAAVASIAAPPSANVDIGALVAALRPELDAAAERAVRRVLGTLDGATPAS